MENKEGLINKEEIIIKDSEPFGGGGEAEVFLGLYKNQEVVIKKYKKEDSNYIKEITAYSMLQSKFMVKYYGYFLDENNYYNLILEKADGIDLQDAIDDEILSFEEKIDILIQICDFLIYLRKNHVIHRDLKPDNIKINKVNNSYIIKLIDFGITKISNNTFTVTSNSNKFTVNYSAPELYLTENESDITILSYKIDIWALGCIASLMFSGYTPWTNKCKNPIKIQSLLIFQDKFPIPDNIDKRAFPLVELCTNISPKKRPNPSTVRFLLILLSKNEDIVKEIKKLEEKDFN